MLLAEMLISSDRHGGRWLWLHTSLLNIIKGLVLINLIILQ